MSASRERKNRQNLNETGHVETKAIDPKAEAAKASRFSRNVLLLICAFLLLGVGLFAYNHMEQNKTNAANAEISATPAVKINGTEYTVGDVAYYFYTSYNTFVAQNSSYLSILGFDTTKSMKEQYMADGTTWFDFFANGAVSSLATTAGIAAEAEAAGFNVDERLDEEVAAALELADLSAKQYGYSDSELYIKAAYGPYVDEEVFARNVRLSTYAQLYAGERNAALSFTDAELKAAYDEDPALFDSVAMDYVLFETDITADLTEEEKEARIAESKAKAEEILAHWARNFEAGAEELGGSYDTTEYARYSEGDEIAEWLFDESRVAGDRVVLAADETTYAAIEFRSRSLNEYHPVTVRHILTADEESAQAVLDEYLAGEQTEEAFSALAILKSTDNSTANNGGLLTGLYKGYYDESFEGWCYDSARKAGDVTVLEAVNGWHVIYFVETMDLPCWAVEAEALLVSEDYQAWYSAFNEKAVTEKLDGLNLVVE